MPTICRVPLLARHIRRGWLSEHRSPSRPCARSLARDNPIEKNSRLEKVRGSNYPRLEGHGRTQRPPGTLWLPAAQGDGEP